MATKKKTAAKKTTTKKTKPQVNNNKKAVSDFISLWVEQIKEIQEKKRKINNDPFVTITFEKEDPINKDCRFVINDNLEQIKDRYLELFNDLEIAKEDLLDCMKKLNGEGYEVEMNKYELLPFNSEFGVLSNLVNIASNMDCVIKTINEIIQDLNDSI